MITRSLSRLDKGREAGAPGGAEAQGRPPPRERAGRPGPPAAGTSGEGKSGVQLLVVYYQRQQPEQRMEREFQQRQREQRE